VSECVSVIVIWLNNNIYSYNEYVEEVRIRKERKKNSKRKKTPYFTWTCIVTITNMNLDKC